MLGKSLNALLGFIAILAFVCACQENGQIGAILPSPSPSGIDPIPSATPLPPVPAPSPIPSPIPSVTVTPSPSPTATASSGWELTVYYTPVESYHTAAPVQVSGCLDLGCSSSGVIGSYPSDFVQDVKNEGAGRITSGTYAGRYLNWSYNVGYWLDTAARDAYGNVLTPFVSSAADTNVLSMGTHFSVSDCGTGAAPSFCAQVESAHWTITDQFTPGYGGSQHIDLYVGEENQPNFEATSPEYTTMTSAALMIQ